MSKLSALLKEARVSKQWTQSELAERSDVPIQTISRYENPSWRGKPNTANVIRLAEHLCIPDEKWLAAIDIPLNRYTEEQRDSLYAEVAALASGDSRFGLVAEMWKTGTDEEKDAALAVMISIFKKPAKPVRRRRLRPDR